MSLSRPFPVQKSDIFFGAEHVYRMHLASVPRLAGGIVGAGDFLVSEKAGTPNMSVDVAAGAAFIRLNSPSEGGLRYVFDTAVNNSAGLDWLTNFTAADGSNPRIDRVILKVRDNNVDSSNAWDVKFQVIPGTPTVGATLANLNGAASVPVNSLLLANVLIAAGTSDIEDADIDSLGDGFKTIRPRAFSHEVEATVSRAAVQSITSGTSFADVTLDTEVIDTDNMWDVSDAVHVFARTPGLYRVSATGSFAANATGRRAIQIVREDATVLAGIITAPGSASYACPVSCMSDVVALGVASDERWVKLQAMSDGATVNFTGSISLNLIRGL